MVKKRFENKSKININKSKKKSNKDVSKRTIEKEFKPYDKSFRWKKFGYLVLEFLKILLVIAKIVELFS